MDKLHLDAGNNADWIKQSWDLPDDTKWVLHNIIATGETDKLKIQSKLDRFLKTRTGTHMPDTMRLELRHMGFRINDKTT